MKKLVMFFFMLAMAAMLAVAANATVVLHKDGGTGMTGVGVIGGFIAPEAVKAPVDITGCEYMYVRFYVWDVEPLCDLGQVEITSSGRCDVDELHWYLGSVEIKEGWNEWKFALADAEGQANLSAINYFRIYAGTDGNNVFIVDYIAFGGENEDFSYLATELSQQPVFQEVTPYDEEERKGSGVSGSYCHVYAIRLASFQDISAYDYAYLRIYVSDAEYATTKGGQFELTSGGKWDFQEIGWSISNLGLVDGWNLIKVDLKNPDYRQFGTFHPENCNAFRFYCHPDGGGVQLELDFLGFGNEGDRPDNLPAYLVTPVETDWVWEDPSASTEDPKDTAVSTISMPTIIGGAAAAVVVLVAVVCAVVIIAKKKKK